MSKEATIIQNFNAEKRKYEYFIKGYDVTKSIEILLKKHKEEYDKERRVFESTKGYLEAQQEYEKHIANLQSQLDQANERLKGAIELPVNIGDTIYVVPSETNYRLNIVNGREEQNKVYEWTVSEIRYNKHGYSVVCDVGDAQFYCNYEPPKNLCGHFDTEKYYGETWFTTREEAEKKLQELRGGE